MERFRKRHLFLKILLLSALLPFNFKDLAHSENLENSPEKYLYKGEIAIQDNLNPQEETDDLEELDLQKDPYILGPGDVLNIEILDSEVSSGEYSILNDGTINIPLAGDILLKGKTIAEANLEITKKLETQLLKPQVSIQILKPRPMTIFVLGEVDQPGIYTLEVDSNNSRVDGSEAVMGGLPTVVRGIQVAGGITQSANLKEVELLRLLPGDKNEYKKTQLNLVDLLFDGAQQNNPFLFDGDIIKLKKSLEDPSERIQSISSNNLSPNKIQVSIIGEVISPGPKLVSSNTPLFQSILEAGGPVNSRYSKANVDLFRINRNGTASHSKFTIDYKKGISPKNPLLRNGDVVRVRRNTLTKASDTLTTITTPLQGIVTVYSLFKILD